MANHWLCSDKVLSQIQKGWKAHLWRSILEHRNLPSPFKYLNKLILTLSEITIFKILLLGQCRKAMGWLTRYQRGILRSVESLRSWWVQKIALRSKHAHDFMKLMRIMFRVWKKSWRYEWRCHTKEKKKQIIWDFSVWKTFGIAFILGY